ncbi:hypothetical protein NDU88_002376 [Pleurodeles waltl]|uniref:Uncharacterized protein n=1 Tax=Pleurodeles waltl TaxID=8319 RepID=A0AAV7M0D4_PLEWA|nr:hypothetical protein NDU88_002376 [Pleurodeles waltl]
MVGTWVLEAEVVIVIVVSTGFVNNYTDVVIDFCVFIDNSAFINAGIFIDDCVIVDTGVLVNRVLDDSIFIDCETGFHVMVFDVGYAEMYSLVNDEVFVDGDIGFRDDLLRGALDNER